MSNLERNFSFSKGKATFSRIETLKIDNKSVECYKYIVLFRDAANKIQLRNLWVSKDGRIVILSKPNLNPAQGYIEFIKKPIKKTSDIATFLDYIFSKFVHSSLKEDTEAFVKKISGSYRDSNRLNQNAAVLIPSAITSIFYLYYLIKYHIIGMRKAKIQKEATSAEQKLNLLLFRNQKGSENEFQEYSEMISAIKSVIAKRRTGIIIGGPPGTGKTYVLRRTLYFSKLKAEEDYAYLRGSTVSISDVYYVLFKYRNKLIVLDDFDTPLLDSDMRNLLKAATDTYPVRIITKPQEKIVRSGQSQKTTEVPDKYEFKGRIIIVTNLPMDKIEPALISRMGYITVDFPAKKMYELIQKMFKYMRSDVPLEVKQEVFDFLMQLKKKYPKLRMDFRVFSNTLDLRVAFPKNWKAITEKILVSSRGG